MKGIKAAIWLALCLIMLLAISGSVAREDASSGKLVVLFTHDLHSYFLPQRLPGADNLTDTEGGYAKLATLIREQRARHKQGETVLVDAGDFSMGTLFHASFMTDALELRLMGEMGYDITTFGNHEFDFHPDGLAKALNAAKEAGGRLPAIVASNAVFGSPTPKDQLLRDAFKKYPVRDYLILEKNGLRVGLFGLMGKDAKVDSPFAKPVTFADPVATGKRVADILKNQEKVDIIICLSHSGTSKNKKHSEDEILAREVPQIDVIISGHTHTILPQPMTIGKTIIVSSGSYGRYLGVLELNCSKTEGVKTVVYTLPKVAGNIQDDPLLLKDIAKFKKTVEREYLAPYGLGFDQPIAESAYDMTSLADAYAHPGETGLGDMITDAYRYAIEKAEGSNYDHIHLVIQPLGNIRSSLLKGEITVSDVFRVLSLGLGKDGTPGYPLLAAYLNGTEIRKLLEVETTVASIKHDAHLQLSGVKFTYNPYRLPFDRVTSVRILEKDGSYQPPDPNRLYRVAMNFYTAQMVDYVSGVSHGLLTMAPKDRQGRPLKDLKEAIIPAGTSNPALREIKEWAALAAYMKSFPDPEGNGIPNLPERYRTPEGRFMAQPSWNPVNLIAGGTAITYLAIGILLFVIIVCILVIWVVARFFRRRMARA